MDVTSGNFCNRVFDVDKHTCQFLELSSATVAFLVKYNYLLAINHPCACKTLE